MNHLTQEAILEHERLCQIRRKSIPPGPWLQEPDRVEFEHAGLKCLMLRNAVMFNWCGYVGVPKGHPVYGKEIDDIDVDVHGGLTYGDHCRSFICHMTEGHDVLYWIGFDCAHSMDLIPSMSDPANMFSNLGLGTISLSVIPIYPDISYVRKETESLAVQLSQMG